MGGAVEITVRVTATQLFAVAAIAAVLLVSLAGLGIAMQILSARVGVVAISGGFLVFDVAAAEITADTVSEVISLTCGMVAVGASLVLFAYLVRKVYALRQRLRYSAGHRLA